MTPFDPADLPGRIATLHRIGIALSKEKDTTRLLESIVIAAQRLVNADGGTLYRVEEGQRLRFEIVRNDSLKLALGGTTGAAIPFPSIPLYDEQGRPDQQHVVTYAVLHDATVNIEDVYTATRFDFTGALNFDRRAGYRSRSFLTVPLKDHQDEIIGVLQLINALNPRTGAVVAFSQADQECAECLASQAAIALTNRLLIDQLQALFETLIDLINIAIDAKSPYTSGHCQRVPILAAMLADAAIDADDGPFKDFHLNEQQQYELKIASLLHDCGKIITPIHVVDKATKLQTLFDRIHLIDTRFEVLKRDARIAMLERKITALERGDPAAIPILEQELARRLQRLEQDRAFLRASNQGGESMPATAARRVREIAAYRWRDPHGEEAPFLSKDEVENLTIRAGTLNRDERRIIQQHVALTHRMLQALPWPKQLRNVPELAGCHHERLDGKGYHRGLNEWQLPVSARIICIADVFEALTAPDRPYKKGKTLSEALTILGRMALDGHIDPDLFRLFMREEIWRRYAERYIDPAQIDAVDPTLIPGYVA